MLTQFLITLIVMLNAFSVLAVLAVFWDKGAFARRPALTALMFATFVYVFGYALEMAGFALEWKRYALLVEYAGIVAVPPLLLEVVGSFGGVGWLRRWEVRILTWGLSVATYLTFATSGRHELFYAGLAVVPDGPLRNLVVDPGPVYLALQGYLAVSIFGANVVLIRAWLRSDRSGRGPLFTLMVASLLPWFASLAYLLGWTPWNLDGPPFLLLPLSLLILWSVRTQALTELRPIARDRVVERLRDPVLVLGHDDRIVDVNAAARALLLRIEPAYEPEGRPLAAFDGLAHWAGRPAIAVPKRPSEGVLRSTGDRDDELHLDGRVLRAELTEILDGRGRSSGRVLTLHDVTTYERMQSRLTTLATTDPLTGLPNRRRLFDVARRWIEREGPKGTPLAVVVLDLDHFKHVNDTWGHEAGDRVLRRLAQVIAVEVRSGDMVARLGGEEFVILLPGARVDVARSIAERIRTAIEGTTVHTPQASITVTASLGLAVRTEGAYAFEALLKEADDALYRAKMAGRNRIETAQPLPPRTMAR